MDCTQARLHLGAEPTARDAPLREHLAQCPACRTFASEMRALDEDIHRVLAPAPAAAWLGALTGSPGQHRERPRARLWALAAGLAGLTVAGALLWGLRPGPALAQEVVRHVEGEPDSWNSLTPVPRTRVARILWEDAGVTLAPTAQVVYASSCPFHGHHVPHLVVRTASGAYTVMILRGEHVRRAQRFSSDGYSGVLLPEPKGTLAVLTRGGLDPGQVAQQIARAISGMG